MGYIVGGRNIIKSASEADFKSALVDSKGVPTNQIPNINPVGTYAIKKDLKTASKQALGSTMDVSRTAPTYNDPRYTASTLAIPTDERTLHGLYRFFAETDPIVGAALKIHGELPLADLSLSSCEDSGVQSHFEEMWEDRINGVKLLNDIVYEYFEIGNVFPFGAFNDADYMWDQFAILNPDYVKVESTWINQKPLIKLLPDEALKRVVQSQSPRYIYDQLPPEIIKYVMFNQEIPLDPNNVFMLANLKRPYENKGRSLIKRILKILMLEDRFNQANFALATRHSVPLTVVKVGDPATGWLPNNEELEAVRDMMANYELDPNFSLIYHYGIDIEYYGSNGKMLPINPELERIYRLKFIGLGIHEQLLTGQGGSYAQAYISMEVQRQRYLNLQLKLSNFVHNGIFKPVADLCGFYKVNKAVVGSKHASKTMYGKEDHSKRDMMKQFSGLRDYQDNVEFTEFISKKAIEYDELSNRESREYIYPTLDFGGLSAAYDENMKNYIKWLAEKRPHLVDDATLAKLGKLDRDTQMRSFAQDLERNKNMFYNLKKEGLLDFIGGKNGLFSGEKGGVGGGAEDLGGMGFDGGGPPMDFGGDMGMGMGDDIDTGLPGELDGTDMSIADGGVPENAGGINPPPGMASMETDLLNTLSTDDAAIKAENKTLLAKDSALKKVIGIRND